MRRTVTLTACLFVAATAAARADQPPRMLPSRDVDVTYSIARPGTDGGALTQRIRWAAATQTLRIDPPSPGLFVVIDYRTHLLSAIRPAQKMVMQVHSDASGMMPGTATSGGSFVRGADTVVAGLSCTDWQTNDSSGGAATVCLTADGVMLRALIGQTADVEAVHVSFDPLSPDLFAVPADYKRIVPPEKQP